MNNFEIARDPHTYLIRANQHGVWTPETVDVYFAALAPVVQAVRADGAAVRILSDRRDCPSQSAETVERAGRLADLMFVAGEKVAIVVRSSLAKLQIRREYRTEIFSIFLSASAAEMWLSAFALDSKLPGGAPQRAAA